MLIRQDAACNKSAARRSCISFLSFKFATMRATRPKLKMSFALLVAYACTHTRVRNGHSGAYLRSQHCCRVSWFALIPVSLPPGCSPPCVGTNSSHARPKSENLKTWQSRSSRVRAKKPSYHITGRLTDVVILLRREVGVSYWPFPSLKDDFVLETELLPVCARTPSRCAPCRMSTAHFMCFADVGVGAAQCALWPGKLTFRSDYKLFAPWLKHSRTATTRYRLCGQHQHQFRYWKCPPHY